MPSSERWRATKHRAIACSLAVTAGYTDVISVTRWTVFGTMCTGNLILMARAIMASICQSAKLPDPFMNAPHQHWTFYGFVILSFGMGACAYQWAERKFPGRGASTLGLPLGLLMFTVEGFLVFMKYEQANPFKIAYLTNFEFGCIFAYSPMFGVLSAACTAGRLATPTTMATGHIVNMFTLTAKWIMEGKLSDAEKAKVMMAIAIVGSNLVGAMIAAIVIVLFPRGSHGALLPVGPALAILFWLHDHLAKPLRLIKALSSRRKLRKEQLAREGSPDSQSSSDSPDSEDEEDDDLNFNLEDEEDQDGMEINGGLSDSPYRSMEINGDLSDSPYRR